MRSLLIAVLLTLALAAQASAAPRLLIDDRGEAVLDGAEAWRICAPGEDCRTVNSRYLKPRAAAGTRVEALVGGTVVRTGTWGGIPVALTLPTLSGPAITGAEVSARAGTWSGGWGDEVDDLGVLACPAPDAADVLCRPLRTRRGRPAGTFTVDADLAGFYLRAIDWRRARDVAAPRSVRPRRGISSQSTAGVAIAQSPPTVQLRRRVMRFSGGYGVGSVSCWPGCTVTVAVTGKRNARLTIAARNRTSLVFPRSAKLRPGLLKVRVTVDGVVRADGFVRLVR